MNDWQTIQQVAELLRAATWPDASLVFAQDAVFSTSWVPEETIASRRFPVAVVQVDGESGDPETGEHSSLAQYDFTVTVIVQNFASTYGESAILGSNRNTQSRGRGLLEVAERVRTTLVQLGPQSGLPIMFRAASAVAPLAVQNLDTAAMISLRFASLGTTFKTWQAPMGLTATGGVGQVSLTWLASPRFDALRFVVRRASGSTPPATVADGTGVTLSSDLATSVTNSGLSAGAYAYSLFLLYDDNGDGTADGTSEPQTVLATVT